jgi:hypothetical protein
MCETAIIVPWKGAIFDELRKQGYRMIAIASEGEIASNEPKRSDLEVLTVASTKGPLL